MLIAKILHNPKAGEKDHTGDELTVLIENEGFECRYVSVKEDGWEHIGNDVDLLVIVGGDGTVRKVARVLLSQTAPCPYLIGLLPFGTANNIAKTLNIHGELSDIIKSWHDERIKNMDAGILTGLPVNDFFIEGFGYGLFPQLMHDMKQLDKKKLDTPEKEIKKAHEVLLDITLNYKPRYCTVIIDGVDHSGEFLMVEVLNIRSIGPNLLLAPDADPGDGVFEIVLMPEPQRRRFADFLQHTLNDIDCPPFAYEVLRGKQITLEWDGKDLHADDDLIELDTPVKIDIQVRTKAMPFLVP